MLLIKYHIVKKQRRIFRIVYYLKNGYTTYMMMVLGAINVLTTTYFLAIDEMPVIKEFIPTFEMYVITSVLVAVPVVTIIGYIHFKRLSANSAARSIEVQNNIFNYRFMPGFTADVFGPAYKMILVATLKHACSKKLTENEIREIDTLLERLHHLNEGGTVGKHPKGVVDD